jgi:transposase-like protein
MTKRFLPRRKDLIEIECKCPKCEVLHVKKVNWAGRGVPRIACSKCSPTFREFSDDGDLTYWSSKKY